jgi:molybdopterin-guanine dinucleotide biosynthesis protein A
MEDVMSLKQKDISGAILAGGKSTRMGIPKCSLSVGGKRVLDRVLGVFGGFFDEILIVTDDAGRFAELQGVKVVEDVVRDCGPLGGIYTGLTRSSREKVFFAACDMPNLHIGFIKRLLSASLDKRFDCIIPHSHKGIEPLHAVYSRAILPDIEKSIENGRLSIAETLDRCNCKFIEARPEELVSFLNINTPEDLRELESHEGKDESMARKER